MFVFRNVLAKERIVPNHSKGDGEMAKNAKTNGTMLDASMMVEIAARILQATHVKMTWLN